MSYLYVVMCLIEKMKRRNDRLSVSVSVYESEFGLIVLPVKTRLVVDVEPDLGLSIKCY